MHATPPDSQTIARHHLPITDKDGLLQALREANIQTLLMSYVHMTQDEDMLERFAQYIRSPYSRKQVEIPAELLQELREKLFNLLTISPAPVIPPLPHSLMRESRTIDPILCTKALSALLDVLQGQLPEGLKSEPDDVIGLHLNN